MRSLLQKILQDCSDPRYVSVMLYLHTYSKLNLLHAVSPLDVPMSIKTLVEEFDCLHERLVNEVSSGGTPVREVLRALTRLPFTFRKEYESTIRSMLPELEERRVVDNLFYRLNPLFTFIDYELLQHLVSKFGSHKLKQEMTSYTDKVRRFKKVTTIGELIDCWPGLEVPPIDYQVLRAKFADDPKSYTLEKLDCFRNRFYNKLRRSEFVAVSILMLVQPTNSFIAEWFIPTVAVQELTEAISQIDRTFFQSEQILELSLGERTLYQRDFASECVISSAMEPLSAFTHVSTKPTLVYIVYDEDHWEIMMYSWDAFDGFIFTSGWDSCKKTLNYFYGKINGCVNIRYHELCLSAYCTGAFYTTCAITVG